MRSKLGYSRNSPFKGDNVNKIASKNITMADTNKPVIGLDGSKAILMNPGEEHSFSGDVTETTPEFLFQVEDKLLEAHLSTLKKKEQQEFIDKYELLDQKMKLTALMEMANMHKDLFEGQAEPLQSAETPQITQPETQVPAPQYKKGGKYRRFQDGGFNYVPSSDFLPEGFHLTEVITNRPDKTNTVDRAKITQADSQPAADREKQLKPSRKQTRVSQTNTMKYTRPSITTVTDAELLDNYEGKVQMGIKDAVTYQELVRRGLVASNAAVPQSNTTNVINQVANPQGQQGVLLPFPKGIPLTLNRQITDRLRLVEHSIVGSPDRQLLVHPATGQELIRDTKTGLYYAQ